MNSAIKPKCALFSSGIQKHIPAASRVQAICGKVKRRRDLLPKVSIVQIAGHANRKLTSPKPHDANNAPVTEAPASLNTVEL
jgi:hypothetical protein